MRSSKSKIFHKFYSNIFWHALSLSLAVNYSRTILVEILYEISFRKTTNRAAVRLWALLHNIFTNVHYSVRINSLKCRSDFFRMPNEKICACGVATDLSKPRNSSIVMGKLTILLPKTKGNKSEGKDSRKQLDDGRVPKTQTSSETGSSSTVTGSSRSTIKHSKHEKRLTHSRRTRSADRAESHYTYIG